MTDWAAFLSGFHAERPGVTEALLQRCSPDAYAWLASAVPDGARVLDLACGSAPTARHLRGSGTQSYVGADSSPAELALARRAGAAVVQADAAALPLPDACVDVVVCSMALQLLPLAGALPEVVRVLRPGGLLVATVPASGPLSPADALRWGRLLLALRQRRLGYPNDDLAGPLAEAGLDLLEDDAQRLALPVRTTEDADLLLSSLYLPGAGDDRLAAATAVVRGWVGHEVGVPLRRLVARRR